MNSYSIPQNNSQFRYIVSMRVHSDNDNHKTCLCGGMVITYPMLSINYDRGYDNMYCICIQTQQQVRLYDIYMRMNLKNVIVCIII